MRMAWLVGGVAGLVFVGVGRADEPLKSARVVLPTIDVKAGPGWNMAKCGTLQRGQTVTIARTEGEFYAILPPEGSESWVNHRFLGKVDPDLPRQNVEIRKETEVYLGSESGPTNVKQVKLPQGQQVEIIGPKKSHDGSVYYPISPPKGEYRYITIKSVQDVAMAPGDGESATGGRTRDVPGTLTSRGVPAAAAVPAGQGINHALWAQAEEAYRSGDYARADKLFTRIYRDMDSTGNFTYDDKLTCFNRIAKCQEMQRKSGSTGDAGRFDAAGKSVERSSNWNPGTAPAPREDRDARSQNSGALLLSRASFTIDGKQAYRLERGREVAYYVTVQTGVTVDAYVGKVVEATGTVQTRGDLGVPYMSVSKISAAK